MTTPLTPDKITDTLTAQFGPRVVALLDAPEKRAVAHRVLQLLADREGEAIARAWAIGMNPHLDDQAPILAIADGQIQNVEAAAHAYLDGSAP